MKVYNTLSRRKEEFTPQGDEVKMYVCGITPYADAHLGHAMSYIIFDVIRRYLRFRGYNLKFVQNITDIDDKIINRANQLGIATDELAQQFTDRYFADMAALNVTPADETPRATVEVPKMLEVIQGLIDKGYAYPAQGSVYFRVRNVPDYGKLSHRNLDSMMTGTRFEAGEEKEHPMDFVLWKASKPGEPTWDSPWGPGRPGWHIECSAMSLRYLGDSIDIHGGGQDLVFPHHENEIAQSESFTGVKPFVKYWLHNGMVQLGEEKMSKSLGNLITIKQALEKYSADAIRVFVLSSHYRSPLTYSEEILEAAAKGADRLRQTANTAVSGHKTGKKIDSGSYRRRFIEAMDDDFNTAQALAALFDLAREINTFDAEGFNAEEARDTLKDLGNILGLILRLPEEPTLEAEIFHKARTLEEYATNNFKKAISPIESNLPRLAKNEDVFTNLLKDFRNNFAHGTYPSLDKAESSIQQYRDAFTAFHNQLAHRDFEGVLGSLNTLSNSVIANIGSLSDFREQLRKEKKWQLADEIRAKLEEAGIALEDTPQGTTWKQKR